MSDEKLSPYDPTVLSARISALADVLSRLLAHEAKRHENPEDFLKSLSAVAEDDTRRAIAAEPLDQTTILIHEVMQGEVDLLVGNARLHINRRS